MTYLEAVHRNCQIATEDMVDLLHFALVEHYQRTEIAGTNKGHSILQVLMDVDTSMVESVRIKLAFKGGAA